MTISEKVSYLKGLIEGLSLDSSKPETKVISKIVDILDELALSVEDLEDETAMLNDYVDELDHDLGELEEYVYADEIDEDECVCCHDEEEEYDEDEDEDDDLIEVECPKCGDTIFFDETIDLDDIICPNCHNHFSVRFIDEDECDECCCDECEVDEDEDEE